MSEKIGKSRTGKLIIRAIEAREELIINTIFEHFMGCLRPKPRWLPLIFLKAFLFSLLGPKICWAWFKRKYCFDLGLIKNVDPNRWQKTKDEIVNDIEKGVFTTNGQDPIQKLDGGSIDAHDRISDTLGGMG